MASLKFGRDELGSGGFCRVHPAWREDDAGERLEPRLAIKFLKDEFLGESEIVARFQREVRLLQDELSHPNIIEVVSRNLSESPPWFTMPLMRTSLDKAIAAGEVSTEGEINRLFAQVLDAMSYAHDKGIIHRDLKPHNVLLDWEGDCHVSDFGLGKILAGDTNLTKSRMWAGTEPYMAPEQWTDMKGSGPEADVFALGKVLVHIVTRAVPPVGAPDLSTIPDPYSYFIRRCCETDPARRYLTAGEALEEFRRLTSDDDDKSPEIVLLELVDEWFNTEAGADLAVVQKIHEIFITNRNDEELYTRRFPALPQDIDGQYQGELPEEFLEALRVFDGHVSGGLPFDYCDTVANFYRSIWMRMHRLDVLEIVIRRLIIMGTDHNRFYVRTVLVDLVASLADGPEAKVAAGVITAEARWSSWHAEQALQKRLSPAIRKAFESVST